MRRQYSLQLSVVARKLTTSARAEAGQQFVAIIAKLVGGKDSIAQGQQSKAFACQQCALQHVRRD